MINDVISSSIAVAGAAEFTVDVDALEVAVTAPPANGLPFSALTGLQYFALGDSPIVTGLWVNLPYGFGQGTGRASVGLVWRTAGGTSYSIPELSSGSFLTLPTICPLTFPPNGLFLKAPVAQALPLFLNLTSIALNVSMANVPTALDGQVLKVQFHLQVLHTKILTA